MSKNEAMSLSKSVIWPKKDDIIKLKIYITNYKNFKIYIKITITNYNIGAADIEKHRFHCHKNAILVYDVDIKIKQGFFGRKGFK